MGEIIALIVIIVFLVCSVLWYIGRLKPPNLCLAMTLKSPILRKNKLIFSKTPSTWRGF